MTPSAPPATNQRPGGLVGAIDASRIAAVCANAQSAQTVLAVGDTKTATTSLVAAAVLLERPPVDPKAAADAVAIRRDLGQGHADAAVTVALTYCRPR